MSFYLCGNTGIVNRGCEAIVRSTCKLLGQRGGDVYLATAAPEMDLPMSKELGINQIAYNRYPTRYHHLYAMAMRRIFRRPVDGNFLQADLFAHLKPGDVCLNIGGDTYCYGRPERSMQLNDFTSAHGIPNVLWCCSVEKDVMQGEILEDLKKYRYILAREQLTYQSLLDAGIPKERVLQCCDPAFFLDTREVPLPEGFLPGNTVGLNVSELVVSEKYPAVFDSVTALIEEILSKTDMNVCLIPHVYDIQKNLCDWPILQRIRQHFHNERVAIVDQEYNCEQLKSIISRCRFLIAARTHASIAAYSTGVPTLVLGYSVKSKGIARDLFGTDEHFVLRNTDISPETLSRDFWYVYEHEDEIRTRLRDFLPAYRDSLTKALQAVLALHPAAKTICDPNLCTGCMACRAVCPRQCIAAADDPQGFTRPVIDENQCVSCGLCRKVCPAANKPKDDGKTPMAYAAINRNDQQRRLSSSGGVWRALADKVLQRGGVVFGAVFDENYNVVIAACDTPEKAVGTCGSKYVQADVGNAYQEAKRLLEEGRQVLYCGTPCQIGGLYATLPKDYPHLITVDIVCHGVPSPLAWKDYLAWLEVHQPASATRVSFRDKSTGWRTYSFTADFDDGSRVSEPLTENLYMQAFLSGLTVRPSCFECSFKQIHRQADLTLGDFWGVDQWQPERNDNKGISAVLVHSEKGEQLLREIAGGLELFPLAYEEAVRGNSSYYRSKPAGPFRKAFAKKQRSRGGFVKAARLFCGKSKNARLYRKIMLLRHWQ